MAIIQRLFGSFEGDAFDKRALPFFLYAMCDVLAKRHSGDCVGNVGL